MQFEKSSVLSFTDIVVLSLIFFGMPAYSSLAGYLELQQNGLSQPETLSINELASYSTMIYSAVSVAAAWLYLRWRKFDFGTLDFRINRYTLPLTLLLVLCAGAAADVYQLVHSTLVPEHYPETAEGAYEGMRLTPELVITSLFNGFFEEIFFMGLVFAVAPKMLSKAFAYSLLVRFVFHTYQGLAGALTVTTLGISFFLLRRKIPYLVPFFLAHGIFDIFGLTALGLVFR